MPLIYYWCRAFQKVYSLTHTHRSKRENQTRKRITQFASHISHLISNKNARVFPKWAQQSATRNLFFFEHARASRENSICLWAVMLFQKNVQTNWSNFFSWSLWTLTTTAIKVKWTVQKKNWKQIRKRSYIQ